jgi:nucleoid-associated protein YgaU
MPKLGDVTLNVVYSEDRDAKVKTPEQPVEDGFKITDHVQKEAVTLAISGVCTGPDASARLAKLEKYAENGERLTYVGRYSMKNALIQNISTTKDVEVAGTAYKFDITLKQARIVKTSTYKVTKPTPTTPTKPPSGGGKQQPTPGGPTKRYHVVVKGDMLSRIAQKYYGHGTYSFYMKIYNANKAIIGSNPNLIKPGQKLLIP